MGQTRGVRCSRGGTARILGQSGSAYDAPPQVTCNLKREISEKKWTEARTRMEAGRYGSWEHQVACLEALPDEDRSLPYQAVSPVDKEPPLRSARRCWCPTQTWDHLFKVCLEWKAQQKILWAEVWKESGRGKSRFTIRDLLAHGRCS